MLYFMLFTLLIGIAGAFAGQSEEPRTRIKQGEIIGTTYETYSGRKVPVFYGLPFAAPPVNELRFQPPYPPESWDKPKIATNRSDFCVQLLLVGPVLSIGSEDCLYLDVYTPKVPDSEGKCEKLYPVLFFAHPSGAIATSGVENEPFYMMDKHDIVFVPAQYRLGILGLLTTDDETVPGNNLYKDQVAALKWIQENIRSFCGNPDLVTFSGASQGSLSIGLHLLSPLSKGLFHRTIGVSGTPYLYFTFSSLGNEVGKTVANQLNCPTAKSREMVECLRLKNADLFWDFDLQFRAFFLLPLEIFQGTIEVCHENAFLTKTPNKALADGDLAQNIPILNIESEFDGLAFAYLLGIPGITELLDLTYESNFKYIFDFYHLMPPHLYKQTSEKIKKEYFGDGLITGNELAFKKMLTDGVFSQGFYESVTRYSRHTKSPVYNMRDYYRGVFSTSTTISLVQTSKNYGCGHYDASLYAVFDGLADKKFRLQKKDEAMVDFMTELYYSFMVDGKPSVADKIRWTPQPPASSAVHYLHFDNPYRMHMTKEENYGNRKFWQSLPIDRYYGFRDDNCAISGNKTSNTNDPNATDKNHHKHQHEIPCDDQNHHQPENEHQQQTEDEEKSHNEHHHHQIDCDEDDEKQIPHHNHDHNQAQNMHQNQIEEKSHNNQHDHQIDCDEDDEKQIPHHNHDHNQAQNMHQNQIEEKSHNNQHNHQIDNCDEDYEKQMQADRSHQKEDLQREHQHQIHDQLHHREDLKKERQHQRREHLQYLKELHKYHSKQ